jgi:hypothetical protein
MRGLKKITLVLNTNDPEQEELYQFVNSLPNGQKRNSSAFLRTLVDREYQKKKEQYLANKKETQKASHVKVIKSAKANGLIKYNLMSQDINQDTN